MSDYRQIDFQQVKHPTNFKDVKILRGNKWTEKDKIHYLEHESLNLRIRFLDDLYNVECDRGNGFKMCGPIFYSLPSAKDYAEMLVAKLAIDPSWLDRLIQ